MRLPRESPRSSRGASVAIRCSRSLKRICLTSAGHNWPGWSCGCAGPWPGAPARMPSPPLSPPRETGTICGSAFGNGSTTAATGRVPARPNWGLCFAPLLRWVLAWWCSDRLALAVDPTLKGDDTTAIVISVVYRGCAIPVAWRILHANKPGAMDPIGNCCRPWPRRSQKT